MSTKYSGGFITKSPVAPTSSAASGIWTLDQQQQAQKAGTWPSPPIFIEDMFSTYLYTGVPGGAVTVNNGINLSADGGLVWVKRRNGVTNHLLADTARGGGNMLESNTNNASSYQTDGAVTFNTNGFTTGSAPSAPFVSWTFKEQPKFFDIVTYTGNATSTAAGFQVLNHSLGSTPGCMIVKATSASSGSDWYVWHRTQVGKYANLNYTSGFTTDPRFFNNTSPTSTTFTVGDTVSGGGGYGLPYGYGTNENGVTYVAYLFAHDAGGFPVSGGGSTNGITCGSFTANYPGGTDVNLGYEPQLVILKSATSATQWYMIDNMRGWNVGGNDNYLSASSSGAESPGEYGYPTATGFNAVGPTSSGETIVYIAIRRGPMKPPTVGTSVFSPTFTSVSTSPLTVTTNFPVDLTISRWTTAMVNYVIDRLRGASDTLDKYLITDGTDTEANISGLSMQSNTAVIDSGFLSGGTNPKIFWNFRRAPGFFDEVCYTGTGVAGLAVTHNLTVVPELMIVKGRTNTGNWGVYTAPTGNTAALYLQTTGAVFTGDINYWNNTSPTSTQFTVGVYTIMNGNGINYVAYLFATLAGVSKVGSYTGTGALQTVACGFTTGARFVLIKRTDDVGAWFTYDSARGITSGSDPYLLLNSSSAEVTGTNYVDTDTTGFKVTAAAPAALNATGGTYIFLAIA